MSLFPLLTKELTLRIERHVAPSGPEIKAFGNARARKSPAPWPPSAVFAFGAADLARLPEIFGFFGNTEPVFYLSHGGFSPEVADALAAKGYRLTDWQQSVLYGVPSKESFEAPSGISLELVNAESANVAAEVASEGNGWPSEWREYAKDGVRKSILRPQYKLYLARVDGQPAGVADLSWTQDGCCSLGGAAVVPRFRGRGIHASLIQHRLHEASKVGAELVVGCADFGSASFRNQQRFGMRLAYVESAWAKR